MQRLTGDYRGAAATLAQAQAVSRDLGDRYEQALLLSELGALRRLTGDYMAAIASQQQALEALCDLGEPAAQGLTHNELGLAQQEPETTPLPPPAISRPSRSTSASKPPTPGASRKP